MKRKLLTILLLGILLSSCSNINQPEESLDLSLDSNESRYLSFNISQPQISTTRDDNNLDFESGTSEENKINRIYFYFFDNQGNTVKVRKGVPVNSPYQDAYDWAPSEGNFIENTNGNDPNIEKTLSGTLEIRFEDDVVPEQLLTVVNPDYELTSLPVNHVSDVKGKTADYYTGLSNANFVMTNSVYVVKNVSEDDESNLNSQSIVCPTQITSDNVCLTKEEAAQNSVDIYVERVLARLDLIFSMEEADGFSTTEGEKAFKTSAEIKRDSENEVTEIYVKFLGWAVTSTPTTSRLFKLVDDSWHEDNLFTSSSLWNFSALHRSLWAINPSDVQYQWYSYDDITGKTSDLEYGETYNMNVLSAYMQENANPYTDGVVALSNPENPSKAIFAAQIVDASGNYVEIAEYEGKYYKIDDLKTLIASKLDMWFEDGKDADGNIIYSQINYEQVSFQTSMEHNGKSRPDVRDTYYVYFSLSEEAKNLKWYHNITSEDEKEASEIADPQAYIDSMTAKAKVWAEGYCYYYFEIPHCLDIEVDQPGGLGVVRNNLYSATIEAVTKLGTPVYNPGEIIYPETPEPTDNPLVVSIKKLDWRIEHEDIQLSW